MNQKGDVWVRDEVVCFPGSWVGGHDNGWRGSEWRGWQVGVVHERDVREHVLACCQVQL